MLFFTSHKTRRGPLARRVPGYRPRLEALEDRCLPSAGALDPTSNPTGNPSGTVTTSLSSYGDTAYVPLVQPDGKIIAAGTATNKTNSNFGMVRYNADGGLDTSFGSGGIAQASFGSNSAYCEAAALYPPAGTASDGKIVLEGWYYAPQSKHAPAIAELALARFNTNGTLDSTFGSGGEVLTSFSVGSITSRGVVVTSSGQIVAVGDNGADYVLARYNANGTLDTTFGQGGKVTTVFPSGTYEENMALQPDGKLVVVGETGSVRSWQVVRYNANGTLDTTFGTGGVVSTSVSNIAMSAAIYPAAGTANDGKIVVAGYGNPTGYAQVFELARFNPNGSLDSTWGGSGEVTTSTSSANNSAAYGVAIQSDGEVVAAGRSGEGNGNFQFALTRYNTDGSLDGAFGTGGIVTTPVGVNSSNLYGMGLQPNGDIVVAGSSYNGTKYNFAVARYLPSEPQIGSFTANPNPVTSSSSVTLTASNITDGNPSSNITQVAFYYFDSSGNKVSLGTGTQTSPGVWTLTFTVNLASGTYTLYAQAEDSYNVFGDPFALALTLQ